MSKENEELRLFAEALLDVDRLRLVGELARGRGSLRTLAEKAGMDEAAAAAHLEVLSRTGVVALERASGELRYTIDEKALEAMSKRQFGRAKSLQAREPDNRAIDERFTAQEAKFIRSFTNPNGVIKHLPSIHKPDKLVAVLRYAMQGLEAGRIYTEAEFNRALAPYTRDPSSVRRYLIDHGFVDREIDGSAYWLKEGGDDR